MNQCFWWGFFTGTLVGGVVIYLRMARITREAAQRIELMIETIRKSRMEE